MIDPTADQFILISLRVSFAEFYKYLVEAEGVDENNIGHCLIC